MSKLTVAEAISDHMILQRGYATRIWGKVSKAGVKVTAALGKYTASAVSDIEKRFEITMPEMAASCEPQTLVISCDGDEKRFHDVLIGEVYLVTGQSNAEMTFLAEEQTAAYYKALLDETPRFPLIRAMIQHRAENQPALFNRHSKDTLTLKSNRWRVLDTPEKTKGASILGYLFCRDLFEKLGGNVPVGFVMAASGASPLYEIEPVELAHAYDFRTDRNELVAVGGMYNTMVAPVQNMSLSGIVFYQGESEMDHDRRHLYGYMVQSYVAELRRRFRAFLPFYFVQLSSHPPFERSCWHDIEEIREAQYDTVKLVPEAYPVVSRDAGWREGDANMYHPYRKDVLAARMSDLAMAVQFGARSLEDVSSPLPVEAKFDNRRAVIRFEYVSGGLRLFGGAKKCIGFELMDENGVYHPANAKIVSPDTVEVTGVSHPTAVRYGHAFIADMTAYPLENGAGLPCPCFAMQKDSFALNLAARAAMPGMKNRVN